MPIYAYLCDPCGTYIEILQRGDRTPCPNCGASARRKFGFNPGPAQFEPHWNSAAGQWVASEKDLKRAFSMSSDVQSEFTGQTVDIQPVDYRDKEQCGITDADVERMKEEKSKVGAE